jgi:DNA repair protein SbcD/Mre11
MKYILTSDWHVRASNPKYRVDEYSESLFNKIAWIVRLSNKMNIPIIVPGDLFENIRVGIRTINRLIRILKKCKNKIYCVPGQHDKEFHGVDLLPTPYLNLMESGAIVNLGNVKIDNLYGIGWAEKSSEKYEVDDDTVIVMHYCTTPGDPAFFLEENALSSDDVLRSFSEFRNIVTGDYHTPHVKISNIKGQILVNPGCIGRSKKDQINFKPRVYILDTKSRSVSKIYIPIRPSEDVFNIPENVDVIDKEFSEHIEKIIESSKNEENKPSFISTVRNILKVGNFTDRQKEIAEKFYSESSKS